ncbi:MAG: ribonuclease P protein component [Bacteroidales bacterium]|nr:ribonuclease P protein component [Bacteroidales bacterium]MCF8455773.1 ribonuclease P protein component [Bacteroidales bacterium]
MEGFTLCKNERLCRRKLIDTLFEDGTSFLIYPYKVIWMDFDMESKYPAQFGITVSKKNFKRAVQRNQIKRLSREAYRLNKHILYSSLTEPGKIRAFMFIYIARDILTFRQIEDKIILILRRLSRIDEKAVK